MVEAFENFDEMMEVLRQRMDEADKRIHPWQALIQPGEYFVRPGPQGITIYGEVLKDPEDCHRDALTEHYRLCKAYSVACPYGELGDVHVSTIEKIISKDEFEAARRREWR